MQISNFTLVQTQHFDAAEFRARTQQIEAENEVLRQLLERHGICVLPTANAAVTRS